MNGLEIASFIWSIAGLLRGDYKQSEYGNVILPFTVLRRVDCVLELTKATVVYEQVLKKISVKEGLGYLLLGMVYEGFKAKLSGGARPSARLLGRSIECL